LPRVIDHFIVPGQGQYLVMDFVEGRSLAALLGERGGPLGEAEVLPWIRQVADALEYLHTSTPPVIHRDIKPDNIIITDNGRAMLVDFGISKVYEANKGTTIGAKAVTPGFSPPEQYGRGSTDARSDVYALGATLYTLLTGQIPPEGPDLSSGSALLTPPATVNPAVSATVSGAIEAAMTPSVSQRLASAGDFVAALTTGMPTGLARRQSAGTAVTQRRPVLPMVVGGVALVAILALAGWLLSRRDDNDVDMAATTPPATTQPVIAAQPATAEALPTPPPATPSPEPTAASTATPPATPAPTSSAQVFDSRTIPLPGGVTVEQLYAPGGSFMMGSASSEADERPIHAVTLDAFWIDRTEVTNRQFAAFAADTGHQTLAEQQGRGHGFTTNGWGPIDGASWQYPQGPGVGLEAQGDHPVVQVSWDDAGAYCAWAGGRLPTEAEWEYAARGPDARAFPWGDGFDATRLNYCDRNCFLEWADGQGDDGFVLTAPVGSFAEGASWMDALDMAGNVWEWTADWYGPEYYDIAPSSDPRGPDSGVQRVVRGGGWDDTFDFARAANRHVYAPDRPQNYLGFRCVYD
jgi:serine/threonine-protein kinase